MQLAPKHADSHRSWLQVFKADLGKAASFHINSPYYLGTLALIFFAFQIVTGALLMVYYHPSAEDAYTSIAVITDEVRLGWLVRELHRWSTDLLLLLVLLHMVHVYFSRAYRARRSLNWIVGLLLLLCVCALAFSGTLLPWDQYAFWSTDFVRAIMADVPLVGNTLLQVFWGGEVGEVTLQRFYVLHVGILPWLTALFLAFHLAMVWHLGIQTPPSRVGRRIPFLPDFLINLSMAILVIIGLLLIGAVFFPREILDPVDLLSPLVGVKPRWYLLPLYELSRHVSGRRVALIGVIFFLFLCLVPVLDRSSKEGFRRRVPVWLLGAITITGWCLLGLRGYLY
jgi:cytochrome b6